MNGVTNDNWGQVQGAMNEALAEEFGVSVSDISSTFIPDDGRRRLSEGNIDVEIRVDSEENASSVVSTIESISLHVKCFNVRGNFC